ININIADFDAHKHSALPLVADAKVCLEELIQLLKGHEVEEEYKAKVYHFNKSWDAKVEEIYHLNHPGISQGEVIGRVNELSDPESIMICAAGSMPGDLHKAWRARHPKNFHLEYGYSCMGYEIAGGLGAKMAAPEREVYVMVGDGSYLMLAQEIITSIQEEMKLIIVLINNHGFASIGGLSRSLGSEGFGTRYLYRDQNENTIGGDELSREKAQSQYLPVDLAKNAESLGAIVLKADSIEAFESCLQAAKKTDRTTVVYVETDRYQGMEGYCWWEVPVAEVSKNEKVEKAYQEYSSQKEKQRYYLKPPIDSDSWAD
ncbi:MAG: thiamine pyrophosphate-dependent enzyme, partial [Bacteroidota bacterium]